MLRVVYAASLLRKRVVKGPESSNLSPSSESMIKPRVFLKSDRGFAILIMADNLTKLEISMELIDALDAHIDSCSYEDLVALGICAFGEDDKHVKALSEVLG